MLKEKNPYLGNAVCCIDVHVVCYFSGSLGALEFSLLYDGLNNKLNCTVTRAKVRNSLSALTKLYGDQSKGKKSTISFN